MTFLPLGSSRHSVHCSWWICPHLGITTTRVGETSVRFYTLSSYRKIFETWNFSSFSSAHSTPSRFFFKTRFFVVVFSHFLLKWPCNCKAMSPFSPQNRFHLLLLRVVMLLRPRRSFHGPPAGEGDRFGSLLPAAIAAAVPTRREFLTPTTLYR